MDRLFFNFEEGDIYWINKDGSLKLSGQGLNDGGYKQIEIYGKKYKQHRILFEVYHNCCLLPKTQIDHIDRNKSNNCIDNLRLSNNSLNGQNKDIQKNNTSGFKNIHWVESENKWRVQIQLNKKNIVSKRFKNLDDAIEFRNEQIEILNKAGNNFFI